MKYLIFFLCFFSLACSNPIKTVPETQYLKLVDSIQELKEQNINYLNYTQVMHDSCAILRNRPLMTVAQFEILYKYGRLEKYYKICKRNPSQWKYYKGWSTRVFENQDE